MRRTHTRSNMRKIMARRRAALNHGIVLSYRRPEFPTAIVVPREPIARARFELHQWLIATLAWLRPRAVPLLVAAAGMVFVLISADYLTHVHVTPMHSVPAFAK
jgi:hypothetical protein